MNILEVNFKKIFPLVLSFASMTFLGLSAIADEYSKEQICKAAIATIMGRDPKIIKIPKSNSEVVYLNYIRENDGTKWAYKCKLDGNKIIWATDTGRWRVHPDDSIVTYRIMSEGVEITEDYGDDSKEKINYTAAQLGEKSLNKTIVSNSNTHIKSTNRPVENRVYAGGEESEAWVVQVGSFVTKESANKIRDDLQASGFKAYVRSMPSSGGMISRTYIGPKLNKAEAQNIKLIVDERFKINSILIPFIPN